MNWDEDGNMPIGRPPAARNMVLSVMRRLRRANCARLREETGLCARSVLHALKVLREKGEILRLKDGRYFIYEVQT